MLRPAPSGRSGRGGFTLVELLVAMVVMVVAIAGMIGSISSSAVLGEANRETMLAYQAAQRVMEEMQGAIFRDVFILYDEVPGDDPAGVGTAPGATFEVDGLGPRDDDADGFVGEIRFPVPPGAPGTLLENLDAPDFGLPRDLNADGVVDADDHSEDYFVLPVRVRVEWRGVSGERSIEINGLLSDR